MSGDAGIFELAPTGHVPHALHAHDRAFRETNCYADLWIEVLHALGLDPRACLGFVFASDFEGDQWTFFKPSHADLETLYGVRVEELGLYLPLVEHVETQVARRRLPLVEVDSFFLPDTAGTDYRKAHVKTTIAITAIDRPSRRLRYFHNAAFAELEGDDFDGVLRIGVTEREDYLPPYCELAKLERARALPEAELRERAIELARRHFAARPSGDPLAAHAAALPEHVARIAEGGLPAYHAYSFLAIRQLGAAAELGASFLELVDDGAGGAAATAGAELAAIAGTAKMLILKLARVAMHKRPVDLSASFGEMGAAYGRAMEALSDLLRA